MGFFVRTFMTRFREWDRISQFSFGLAIVLLIPALITAAAGPEDLRGLATGSSMGLIISAQLIFMWANRGMVTDYVKAQRHYLNGEFAAARGLLEGIATGGRISVQELTLLGNTYRQLGLLEQSRNALLRAVEQEPDHPFPLYGLGRTQLVSGQYHEATQSLLKALEQGAPPVTALDLAEAAWRLGDEQAAIAALNRVQLAENEEAQRYLMRDYLAYRLQNTAPPSAEVLENGLAYFVAQATLYQHTAYGAALEQDLATFWEFAEATT